MLVLRRRENQKVFIGNITVVITKIRGDAAWIGIDAPKEIQIDREEVAIAKQRNKEEQNAE